MKRKSIARSKPEPQEIVTERRGRLKVAVPVEPGEVLTERTVQKTKALIRRERIKKALGR